jgi:mono/diheme cytochrome c family protein
MQDRVLFAMLAAALLICATPALAQGTGRAADAANGKRVFTTIGCSACHGTVGQGGRPSGPHLAPNPIPYEVFSRLVRHPVNAMPPYTIVVLSEQELGDIYAYLVTIPPLLDPKAAEILDH